TPWAYEWTIEGGVLYGPNGVYVPDGNTLCVGPDPVGCGDCNLAQGDAFDHQFSILQGTGTVQVLWNGTEKGKLKLKVKTKIKLKDKEGNETTIPIWSTDEIEVDYSLPTVTSLSASTNGLNSTTFTANLDKNLCPGQTIQWTLNGNPAGTGATKTFNVGECQSGLVCAFTSMAVPGTGPLFTIISTTPKCRSYTVSTLNASVTGPTDMEPNAFADYILNSNQPASNISWTATPSAGVSFFGGTTNSSALVVFANEGTYDICVTGTTNCEPTFTRCLTVTVDDEGFFRTTKGNAGEVSSNAEQPNTMEKGVMAPMGGNPLQHAQLQLQPNLVQAGQEINIALPVEVAHAQLTIQDIHGYSLRQKIVRDGEFSFSTAGLRPGVYIVNVQSQTWQGAKRFVVQ
ncbi:MAG: hypothetical protein AAF399_23935, partial [Bacteroidota bacterium]